MTLWPLAIAIYFVNTHACYTGGGVGFGTIVATVLRLLELVDQLGVLSPV